MGESACLAIAPPPATHTTTVAVQNLESLFLSHTHINIHTEKYIGVALGYVSYPVTLV